jgi:hypothetical protein
MGDLTMDIDSLREELEQHLKQNPDAQAPDGFRDRFDQAVEHHKAETDAGDKAELEAQLHRIRDEAAAAAKAGGSDPVPGRDAGVAVPRGDPVLRHPVPSPGDPAPVVANPAPVEGLAPGRGLRFRYSIGLAAVAAAAAAAFYFYSGG